MKILILKPSSLGDVVQALPVLRLLRQSQPGSEIYWWLDAGLVSLLERDPDLTGIIPFPRKRWRAPWRWPEAWQSLRTLRRHRFDLVIDLQGLARSGLVAWLTNGGLTVGLDDSREGARGFYDVSVPRPSYHTHAVDWYLAVLSALGVPVHSNFTWMPKRIDVALALREKWPTTGGRWLTLHAGASWPNKRWPIEHFVELVRMLCLEDSALRIAILGSGAERELGARLATAQPERCLDLTGQTSLPELVEWIRLSDLLVSNDSGPMHVAAALGKPVVALFGPTEPKRTGPYRQLDSVLQLRLPCVPCLKDYCRYEKPFECLRALDPSTVAARVEQRLRRALSSPAS